MRTSIRCPKCNYYAADLLKRTTHGNATIEDIQCGECGFSSHPNSFAEALSKVTVTSNASRRFLKDWSEKYGINPDVVLQNK